MKAIELIKELQSLVDTHGNIEVIKREFEGDMYRERDDDIYIIKTEDNSYDKRLRQITKIIIS